MIFSGSISNLRFSLHRFGHDRDGGSAVEFAIVLPFMLTLYLGGMELGEGLQIQFKVTETARTVADLTSQYPALDTSTMASILSASSVVLTPIRPRTWWSPSRRCKCRRTSLPAPSVAGAARSTAQHVQ